MPRTVQPRTALPGTALSPTKAAPPGAPDPHPGPAGGRAAPVGRDAEDRLLRGLLADLRRGRPALVEVSGPPGIGRSTLLDHAAALAAEAGIRVAAAPEETCLPHGIAAQLLGGLHPGTAPAGPDLPQDRAHPGAAATPRPDRLCAAFLTAARSRPLLLVVDDAQWADTPSLRGLQALARRLAGLPLMLLTSRNTAVPQDPYERIEPCPLAEGRSVARHLLELPPLPAEAVGRVLADTWPESADAAFRQEAARSLDGNPALLRSVTARFLRHGWTPDTGHLAHLAESAAEAVRERTVRTLPLLPPELLGVLRAIAVAGPDCTPGLIEALAAGPRTPGTARALTLLSGTGLLADGPRPALRGEAAARAVLADLGTGRREELHARAAAWAHRAALPDRAVARMLLGAGPVGAPWAVAALRRRAAEERAAGHHPRAARLLERALREPVPEALRVRLLTELATAVLPTAPEAASRHLYRALDPPAHTAGPAADPGTVRARLLATELLVARGDFLTPAARIARAVTEAEPGTAEHSALRALHWMAAHGRPDPEEGCEPPLPDAWPARPEQAAEAAVAAWRTARRGLDITRARGLARAALAPEARAHVPPAVRTAAAYALVLCGDTEEARGALDGILVCAARRDARPVAGAALLVTCLAELWGGRDAAASEALDRCEEVMPAPLWHPLMAPGPLALRALLDLRRGADPGHPAAARRRGRTGLGPPPLRARPGPARGRRARHGPRRPAGVRAPAAGPAGRQPRPAALAFGGRADPRPRGPPGGTAAGRGTPPGPAVGRAPRAGHGPGPAPRRGHPARSGGAGPGPCHRLAVPAGAGGARYGPVLGPPHRRLPARRRPDRDRARTGPARTGARHSRPGPARPATGPGRGPGAGHGTRGAPERTAPRGAGPPAARAGTGRAPGRPARHGTGGTPRARRRRSAGPPDRRRNPGRGARRRRAAQPGHRPGTRRHPPHRGTAPDEGLPEARHPGAPPAGRGTRTNRYGGNDMNPLLHRRQELGLLTAALDATGHGAGGGSLTVVTGGIGMGKTALLRALPELAERRGVRVLTAGGAPHEQAFRFGVLDQLLTPLLPATGAAALPPGEHTGPDSGPGQDATRLALVAEHADRKPLLLLVDDLQWADTASLRWLARLAGQLPRLRVTLVAALREGDPGEDEPRLHHLTGRAAAVLRLSPLSVGATADL
ncbi:hypothetical protein VR44_37580, partial [Streptomyces katrae]